MIRTVRTLRTLAFAVTTGAALSPLLRPGPATAEPRVPATGAAVVATRPASPTRSQHDDVAVVLAFQRRSLGEVYQVKGHKDPKWDADAVAFLDLMALHFTYGSFDAIYHPTVGGAGPAATAAAALGVGRRAVAAGCDDPLVLYCMARLLPETNPDGSVTDEHAGWINAVVDAFGEGGYPAARWFIAVTEVLSYTQPAGAPPETLKKVAALESVRRDALVAIATDPTYTDADRWLQLRHLFQDDAKGVATISVEDVPGEPGHYRRGAVDVSERVLALPDLNLWLREMVAGRHEMNLAGDARGDGWAREVAPEQWDNFHKHTAAAYGHYKAAHTLDPLRPEAATELIRLANLDETGPGEGEQYWFDRATERRVDFVPAAHTLTWAREPKWGGSAGEMLDVGFQMADTRRYDTIGPSWLIDTVWRVGGLGGDWTFLDTEPAAYEKIYSVCEGYSAPIRAALPDAERAGDARLRYYRSLMLAFAYRAKRWTEAETLVARLDGGDVDFTIFKWLDTWPAMVRSEVALRNGPQAGAFAAAEARESAESAKPEELVAGYAAVLDALPPDDAGRLAVRNRLLRAEHLRDFPKGEWLDLPVEPALAAFRPTGGKWSVEPDGTLVGVGDDDGLNLLLDAPVGDRYELRGTIEVRRTGPDPEMDTNQNIPYAGFAMNYTPRRHGGQGWLLQPKHALAMYRAAGLTTTPPYQLHTLHDGINSFLLRRDGTDVTLALNDGPPHGPKTFTTDGESAIGLGGDPVASFATVRFRNLRYRRISPEPRAGAGRGP